MKTLYLIVLICSFISLNAQEYWEKIELNTDKDLLSISIDNVSQNGAIIGNRALFITTNSGESWENIYATISNITTDEFSSSSKVFVYNTNIIIWNQYSGSDIPSNNYYSNKYMISSDMGLTWKTIVLNNKFADLRHIKGDEFMVRFIKSDRYDTLNTAFMYTDNIFEGFNNLEDISYDRYEYTVGAFSVKESGNFIFVENYTNPEPPQTYSKIIYYDKMKKDTTIILDTYWNDRLPDEFKYVSKLKTKWFAYHRYMRDEEFNNCENCLLIFDEENLNFEYKSIDFGYGDYQVEFINDNKAFALKRLSNNGKNTSEILFIKDLNNSEFYITNVENVYPQIKEVKTFSDSLVFAVGDDGTLLKFNKELFSDVESKSSKLSIYPNPANETVTISGIE